MKSLIVRLPDDLHAALKQNRQLQGTSSAEFIRRAIRLAFFADQQGTRTIEPAQFAARPEDGAVTVP